MNPGRRRPRGGVTLLEMMIVVGLIGLMAGLVFPPVSAGLETLKLASAGDGVAGFLSRELNRAERRQEAIEITIDPGAGVLSARGAISGSERRLEMPSGVRITGVLPPLVGDEGEPRHFLCYPGGTAPRIGVELANTKGARRVVRVNPITGVPEIERPLER